MTKLTRVLLGGLIATGLSSALDSGTVRAANLEPTGIDLGLTSFFDGFGKNEPGFVYLTYAFYQVGHQINDNSGNAQTIFGTPKINDFVWINQLAWVSPATLFGGAAHVGLNVVWATMSAAITQGRCSRYLRCPYQANVMKTFERRETPPSSAARGANRASNRV